jgi:hypothetical protein
VHQVTGVTPGVARMGLEERFRWGSVAWPCVPFPADLYRVRRNPEVPDIEEPVRAALYAIRPATIYCLRYGRPLILWDP